MQTFATLLSSDNYLPGVLVLHHSLTLTKTQIPFLVLVTSEVSESSRQRLHAAGCGIKKVEASFPIPAEVLADIPVDRWRKCFDKLRFFGMTEFKKIVYLDADMLVTRNVDHLFEFPHLSAVTAYGGLRGFEQWSFPNAGLWVIEPQAGLDEEIWSVWPKVQAATGNVNDQTLVYEFYRAKWEGPKDWCLPNTYNCFVYLIDRFVREKGLNLNFDQPDEKTIAVLHFVTRFRPWLMGRRAQLVYLLRRALTGKWAEIRVYFLYRKLLTAVKRNG